MNRVLLWTLIVFLSGLGPVQAQVLQNGGFENDLTGWETSLYGNATVEATTGGTEGSYCAHIQAMDFVGGFSAEAVLSQTFSAHAGDELLFDVAGYPMAGFGGDATCSVSISSPGWNDYFNIYQPGDFAPYSWILPADSVYELTFRVSAVAWDSGQGADASISTMHIDNVRLAPVPEPSALLLLGIGGAVLSVVHLRRRFR
jgi:hypothetical protein